MRIWTDQLIVSHRYRPQLGYNTLQLLCVIAITAIVSSMAFPAYSMFIVEQHRSSALNAFHHSVLLAKMEANKTLENIVLCPSLDGQQCHPDSKDFSYGWILFINTDKDYPIVRDSDEHLIKTTRLKKADFDLLSNRKSYTFRSVRKRNTNGTLMFCPHKKIQNSFDYQALIISYTGRPRFEAQPKQNHLEICD